MLQLWGFMKVVDIYINLTGINRSEYLHSLWQNSVVADINFNDVAGIYKSSGCLQKKIQWTFNVIPKHTHEYKDCTQDLGHAHKVN